MEYSAGVQQYGYAALFFGTMVEGETFLFLAGVAASQGLLSLEWVLPAAWAGAVIGDQIPFLLGRRHGRAFLKNRPRLRKKCERVFGWLFRYKLPVLLFYRFIYGFRGITPFVFGLTRIPGWSFAGISVCGALAWTVAIGLAGFYSGRALARLGIEYWSVQMLVALPAAAVVFWLAAPKGKDNAKSR